MKKHEQVKTKREQTNETIRQVFFCLKQKSYLLYVIDILERITYQNSMDSKNFNSQTRITINLLA